MISHPKVHFVRRRTFAYGLLLLGGGVAGHYLTRCFGGSSRELVDPKVFVQSLQGLQLQHLSPEMLLRMLSRQVSDHDRRTLVTEIVNHNRTLFIREAYQRQHGVPGFYRLIE